MSANPHGALIKRYVFLYGRSPDNSEQVSSFRAALREARTLTDRDPETGERKKRRRNPPTEWSGALMYLVLLEQIGKVLRPDGRRALPKRRAGKKLPKEQYIARTLRYFGEQWVAPKERGVLVALRNGFAHDFGLTNTTWPRVVDNPQEPSYDQEISAAATTLRETLASAPSDLFQPLWRISGFSSFWGVQRDLHVGGRRSCSATQLLAKPSPRGDQWLQDSVFRSQKAMDGGGDIVVEDAGSSRQD